MAFDVFISYPHQDKATADAARAKLEAESIRCWIAPRDIAPSADWPASIVDAIDCCRVMVLIFSAHANRSKQVGREVQRAFEKEKPVVPFRIEDVTPEKGLAFYMASVHWLDALTPPIEQHLQNLVETVKAIVQVDPTGRTGLTGGNVQRASVFNAASGAKKLENGVGKKFAFLRTKKWPRAVGLAALALLCAGVLAISETTGILQQLIGRTAPALDQNQKTLKNIVEASYGNTTGITPNIPSNLRAPIKLPNDLYMLYIALRNFSPEMVYWLFVDRFELGLSGGQQFGFRYNPPDDYGCSRQDVNHRCFLDWVYAATFTGLNAEPKKSNVGVARLCFNKGLADQARNAVPPDLWQASVMNFGASDAALFQSPLNCESDSWNPADDGPHDIFSVTVDQVKLTIVPRSTFGVYGFLGNLLKVQRERITPSDNVYVPSGRADVTVPPALATEHNGPLLTILQSDIRNCFTELRSRNVDYCVPNTATTTISLFNLLGYLTGDSNAAAN